MPNGIEGRFERRPPKETNEKSPEKAIREHLDNIKNPLLSKLSKGEKFKSLESFFEKAEAQLKGREVGDELALVLGLPTEEEAKARINLENFSAIREFFENPPKVRGLETKDGKKKNEINPEVNNAMKLGHSILQQEVSASSFERKKLVNKFEKSKKEV